MAEIQLLHGLVCFVDDADLDLVSSAATWTAKFGEFAVLNFEEAA